MPLDTKGQTKPKLNHRKLATVALVLAALVGGFWLFGDRLSLESLAEHESVLVAYRTNYPILTVIAAISVYIVVAGLSLPAAAVLTLACGWYFGFWLGLVVVSFGSTGGATLSFLLTRYLFREWAQRTFADRFAAIERAFEREGAFYLFTLRLIPAVPFFAINVAMGLTKIRTRTFWWVSQLGMLPGTAAYVYAGSTFPSLKQLSEDGVGTVINWQLLLAFAILGLLPLVIKRAMGLVRPTTTVQSDEFTQRR